MGKGLEELFTERFGVELPEPLNANHRLHPVAAALDTASERIVMYLADHGVRINVLYFAYYRDVDREYLARSWLIDPLIAEVKASSGTKKKLPWDGKSFYVVMGEGESRSWEDARRYGFVCAGQGRVYSRPLDLLYPGAIVYAYVPGAGYVGAGEVLKRSVPLAEFTVNVEGMTTPIAQAPTEASNVAKYGDDLDRCEYFVRVGWIHSVAKGDALRERGMFAIPTTVARLRHPATLERLQERFPIPSAADSPLD